MKTTQSDRETKVVHCYHRTAITTTEDSNRFAMINRRSRSGFVFLNGARVGDILT